jgi:peroxiredoxin
MAAMKTRWLAIALVVCAVFALATPVPDWIRGWLASSGEVAAQSPVTGGCPANAPAANLDFTLKDMNGADVKLASLKGKVVLLNFWATWCGPCLMEIPSFVEIQAAYKEKGFQAVGVSVDDTPDKLGPFAKKYGVNYPLLVGLEREDIQEAYGGVFGIPISFVISRDGKVCRKQLGPASKAEFESWIKALL